MISFPNAIIGAYVRTSTYSKREADSQRAQVLNYIKSNFTLCNTSIHEYIDNGVPDTILDPPALSELLHDISEGRIDIVIVADVTKISTSREEQQRIVSEFSTPNRGCDLSPRASVFIACNNTENHDEDDDEDNEPAFTHVAANYIYDDSGEGLHIDLNYC